MAVSVCALTATAVFYIHGIASRASGLRRAGWAVLTGVASGAGIWATHFIAMLAFTAGPYAIYYGPRLTFLSLLIAIVFTAVGFAIAIAKSGWWWAPLGGIVIGLGIGTMHYTGMAAMNFPGVIVWDEKLVAASLAFGVIFGAAATAIFHHGRFWGLRWVGSPLLLTAGICGLHFTAMGAAVIFPDPTVQWEGPQLDTWLLALAVAGITLIALLIALVAGLIDYVGDKESILNESALAEAVGEGIVVSKDGRVISVNRHFLKLCSRRPEDLLGKPVFGDLLSTHVDPRGSRPVCLCLQIRWQRGLRGA